MDGFTTNRRAGSRPIWPISSSGDIPPRTNWRGSSRRDNPHPAHSYRLSNSQSSTITWPPGLKSRSFPAMVARSETVAFSSLLANWPTFLRRCRRRLISFRRSLHGTFWLLGWRHIILHIGAQLRQPPRRRYNPRTPDCPFTSQPPGRQCGDDPLHWRPFWPININFRAEVAELADALGSGPSVLRDVEVQILSSAP